MEDEHRELYGKAIAFFRGTQVGDAARAARWRGALWIASANSQTWHAALETLQCAPDRSEPGARYAALDGRDRRLLDVAAALLQEGAAVDPATIAHGLDAARLALVHDGLRLRDGADPASLG